MGTYTKQSVNEPSAGEIDKAAKERTMHVDPEKLTLPALARGYVGRVPWAIVERGDGLILAIGGENLPVDTPEEWRQAEALADKLKKVLYP